MRRRITRLQEWSVGKKIIFFIIIFAAIFTSNYIEEYLQEIDSSSYQIYYKSKDLKNIKLKEQTIINTIKVKSTEIQQIEITDVWCEEEVGQGKVELNIYNDNDELVFSDSYKIEEAFKENRLIIDLKNISFNYPSEYIFKFIFSEDTNLGAKVNKETSSLLIKQIFQFQFKGLLRGINISIVGIFIGLCGWILKKDRKITTVFLVIVGLFGGYFLILSPPMNALDEYRHFYRAYDIAQGNLTFKYINKDNRYPESEIEYHDRYETDAPAAVMPENYHNLRRIGDVLPIYTDHIYNKDQQVLMQDYLQLYKESPTETDHYFSLRGTASYNPLAYLPQIIPIKIGMILELPPIVVMNLARMGNFLVWIVLSILAIKITPRFKELFLLVALMPTNIHLATSNSTDGFLNGLLLLLVAYILDLKKKKLEVKDKVILVGITCIVGAIKIPYVVFIILILMLEEESMQQKVSLILGTMILALLIYFVWNTIYIQNMTQVYESFEVIPKENTAINEYIKEVLLHPFKFMNLVLTELKNNIIGSNAYIFDMVSRVGWGSPVGSDFIAYSYFAVIIMSMKSKDSCSVLKKMDQYIIGIAVILLYIGISFIAFTWKPLGTDYIWGIQGRYFIAIMPLIGMLWSGKREVMKTDSMGVVLRKKEYLNSSQALLILYAAWCLCETLQQMLTRYWIG